MEEHDLKDQGGSQIYNWTWDHSRDRAQDDPLGHKAVFAFLHRNPSTGNADILSKFSLWIIDSPSAGQDAGHKQSEPHRPSSTNSRHWRQASIPERIGGITRLGSFHSKGVSVPSSHASLLDASTNSAAPGLAADAFGPTAGLSSNPNLVPLAQDTEDGPLFRATVAECENHIRDMKASTKRIIKAAQTVLEARKALVVADEAFVKEMEGFKPAEPLINNYLRPMSQCLAETADVLGHQMRSLLIEPLSRFYSNDIKAAEVHRKSFDDESKEYYQFLSRYMAMKQESNRKKGEADAKYEKKRRQFEVKRFEYWGFLLDMRVGGSKSDEILHHLTNYSEKHCRNMMDTALLAEDLKPGLDLLAAELLESHKRAAIVRKERQERRKELLDSHDDGPSSVPFSFTRSSSHLASTSTPPPNSSDAPSDGNLDIPNVTQESPEDHQDSNAGADQKLATSASPTSSSALGSAQLVNNTIPKFTGIRDLEHQDIDASSALGRRKEGFLFATSRPSMHNNSAVLEKPSINWHKYWCVVSEGHLHEYSHWKKGATMLHNEPINLKISTVRPCRNQDRRFCFEVITPKYRRVYQATSAEDMNSWVSVISNAIQSLLNGSSSCQSLDMYSSGKDPRASSNYGVDGFNSSLSAAGRSSMDQAMHVAFADRNLAGSIGDIWGSQEPTYYFDHLGTRLLKIMRETHPANNFCAECGAKNPDWCAINLGILICIECSGIHRSLGTHISKVRSFTLDTTSYTRDLFDFIRSVGNEISNRIWEANLVQSAHEIPEDQSSIKVVFRRPLVNDMREYKVAFIQKKYAERAFVDRQRYMEGADPSENMAILATKGLFQAAITNNIPDVIAAYAAGADLNAVQESDEQESETIHSGTGHGASEADGTTGSSILGDGQMQSSLEGLTSSTEGSPRLSRSTIGSMILNASGVGAGAGQGQQQGQQTSVDVQDSSLSSTTDPYGSSSFMVMQTSPLLLALQHGVPFSLDEQYEVYPMAEFMIQNGATSNLSVEVRLIDDDTDGTGQPSSSDGTSAQVDDSSTTQQNALLLSTDATTPSSEIGWDSTQVDLEDIRNHQQRSNRRSLGQVVHMRGEGGGTAMEYLRAKSAARGELMLGSPPAINYNDPMLSTSPNALSPRLRPQNPIAGPGSISAPTSATSSPTPAGTYSTTLIRQPSSTYQDISTLFQKRRESDSASGPALPAAGKTTESSSDKKSGSYKLQNAATVPSSPAMQQHSWADNLSSHSALHYSSSRAHKMKATLSKSLRLSAAYIKNNMLKEDRETLMSNTAQAVTPSVPSSSSSLPKQGDAASVSSNASNEATPTISAPTTSTSADQTHSEAPLSGPYVILHRKGSNPPTPGSAPSSSSNAGAP
ncbi:hypothetical protein BC939DRAFT_19104 [Gamsiella multidivaricata]|uniref:uncharacterized protein n=1 Tax=Gamsiella multidivaricata TaxID=101098 RepID=UPI0022204241|nr:uncharacterized protein BC939DRAFT_19104 [Gamsiella multidivaricata]KAI7817055.1 hypothetical protein BC939DRAFT_19104 [Gamsiella multidivaricata]